MTLFKQWTKGLRLKLLIMSLVPTVALAIVAYQGISTSTNLKEEIEKAYNVRAPLIRMTGEMEAASHAAVRYAWTAANADTTEEKAGAVTHLKESMDAFDTSFKVYQSLPKSTHIVEMFKPVEQSWPKAEDAFREIIEVVEKGGTDVEKSATHIIVTKVRSEMKVVTSTISQVQDARRKVMDQEVGELQASTALAVRILTIASMIAGIASFALGVGVATSTTKGIERVTGLLRSASEQVSAAATQIAASSEELSQATSEQAASLEETAASIDEMTSMVGKNTENAKKTAATSSQSREKSTEGKQAVEKMMGAMNEINLSNDSIMNQTNKSNEQMQDIVKVIQEIGNKTKVINDIVFQTKLLSFNASVEAARAGEHGKGFAVVAEEVGNLAQMSGNAAKEISTMLQDSIGKVESMVQETKVKIEALVVEGKEKVDSGVTVAKQCEEVLDAIVNDVSSVSNMATEISSASQEQAQGISEINKAVNQLDQVTQQNAATSEQAASAAEELSAQAEHLKAAVLDLAEIVDGAGTHRNAAPSVAEIPARKSNVVAISKPKASAVKAAPARMKSAAGDGTVPDRNHDGFKEV